MEIRYRRGRTVERNRKLAPYEQLFWLISRMNAYYGCACGSTTYVYLPRYVLKPVPVHYSCHGRKIIIECDMHSFGQKVYYEVEMANFTDATNPVVKVLKRCEVIEEDATRKVSNLFVAVQHAGKFATQLLTYLHFSNAYLMVIPDEDLDSICTESLASPGLNITFLRTCLPRM